MSSFLGREQVGDLYVQDDLIVRDSISCVSIGPVSGSTSIDVEGNLVPISGSAYNLGSPGLRYNNIYSEWNQAKHVTIQGSASLIDFDHDGNDNPVAWLHPASSKTALLQLAYETGGVKDGLALQYVQSSEVCVIGDFANSAYTSVLQWTTGGSNVSIARNLMPLTTKSYSIGSSSQRFTDLYAGTINLHGPGNNISYVTGSATAGVHFSANNSDLSVGKVEYVQSYKRLYLRGVNTDGSSTDGCYLHLSGFVRWHTTVHQWPSAHQALDLGASTLQYRDVHCVSVTESSDPRMKNSVSDLDSKSIAFIDALRPRTYRYNSGSSGRFHAGFLSTEVKGALDSSGLVGATQGLWTKAQKNLEGDAEIEDGMESLRYSEFIGHMVLYMQQLEARLTALGG